MPRPPAKRTKRNQHDRAKSSTKRKGFAFTLEEKWDIDVLGDILKRRSSLINEEGEFDASLYRTLQEIYVELRKQSNSGTYRVNYYASESAVAFKIDVRVFGNGLQSVPGWVRRLCGHRFYHDVDIENCAPTILHQLKLKVGLSMPTPYFDHYVNNRDDVLEADMDIIPGLTRSVAKMQYLKVLYGARDLVYESKFLLEYRKETEYIREHLWHMQQFQPIRMYAELSVDKERHVNVKARFLSTVIATIERSIVEAAMARFRGDDLAYKVDTYIFDGFLVRRHPNLESIPQEDLTELRAAVAQVTGYTVRFVEKSMEPTAEDIAHLRPAFNNMNMRSKADTRTVFLELGILARRLNESPSRQNAAVFRRKLVPIMNKAFARLRGSVALVVTRRVDGNTNNVKYTRCKINDIKMNYESEGFYITVASEDDDDDEDEEEEEGVSQSGEKKKQKGPELVEPIKVWLKSKNCLVYDSVVFNPRPYSEKDCATPFQLNTFVGIAYPRTKIFSDEECRELEQHDLKPFWEHIFCIWCNKNEELFEFVRAWIWSKVVRPWYRVESALILQSEQGAGKGVIVNKIAEVLGLQYMSKPSSLDQITGNNFNRHYFENCLIMFLDEAFYAGSKATKNQVKTIITDSHISINEKFMPKYIIENFLSMVLASNEDHVINREVKSRRYLNLGLSNTYAGIHKDGSKEAQYFDTIRDIDPQLLSNYLHSLDFSNWTGRDIPTTLEGELQAFRSFSNHENFVLTVLQTPEFIQTCRVEYLQTPPGDRDRFELGDDKDALGGLYSRTHVYRHFKSEYSGYRATSQVFWEYFKKVVPSIAKYEQEYCAKHARKRRARCDGGQYEVIFFPNLDVARAEYKKELKLVHYSFEIEKIVVSES